jgi:hypothetical protein
VTISGQGFSEPLTVSFGTNAGTVNSINPTTVSATTPSFPDSIFVPTQAVCDDDGDLTPGFRFSSVSVDVTLRNPVNGCQAPFVGGYLVNPSNTSCQND